MSEKDLSREFLRACNAVRAAAYDLIEANPNESIMEFICDAIENINEDACQEFELTTGEDISF